MALQLAKSNLFNVKGGMREDKPKVSKNFYPFLKYDKFCSLFLFNYSIKCINNNQVFFWKTGQLSFN